MLLPSGVRVMITSFVEVLKASSYALGSPLPVWDPTVTPSCLQNSTVPSLDPPSATISSSYHSLSNCDMNHLMPSISFMVGRITETVKFLLVIRELDFHARELGGYARRQGNSPWKKRDFRGRISGS